MKFLITFLYLVIVTCFASSNGKVSLYIHTQRVHHCTHEYSTVDPTVDPTKSPTRHPTVSNAYNSLFVIQYLILNLKQEHIDMLLSDAQTVSGKMTDIIEKSYTDATGLKLQFFWLEIEEILGFEIKDIDMNKQAQFLQSQEISIKCTMKCNTDACDILLTPQFQHVFLLEAQSKLREYFGALDMLFQIDGDTDDIKVIPNCTSQAQVYFISYLCTVLVVLYA
eukprot:123199_1